jgi:hypothetical protein
VNDIGSANRITYWLAGLHEYRGEFDRSQALMRQLLQTAAGEERELVELHDQLAAEMQTLAVQGGLPYRQATAGVLLGWACCALGEPAAGCRDLDAALAGYRRTGAAIELPYFLILYADAAASQG